MEEQDPHAKSTTANRPSSDLTPEQALQNVNDWPLPPLSASSRDISSCSSLESDPMTERDNFDVFVPVTKGDACVACMPNMGLIDDFERWPPNDLFNNIAGERVFLRELISQNKYLLPGRN
jgi:hypothetical protein